MELTEYDRGLMASVRYKSKHMDLGRSPVSAIDRGFRLVNEGYLEIDREGWIRITSKGVSILEAVKEGEL